MSFWRDGGTTLLPPSCGQAQNCSLLWVFPSPPPFSICQTFLSLNPQSGSRLIEFAPPFHLCGFQVPALLQDRTKAFFTWLFLPSVKRYLPACLAVEMGVCVCSRSQNRGGGTHIGGVVGWNRKKTQALWGLKRIQFGDPSCSEGKYHYRYEIGYNKRSQEILDFQEWTNTKPRKIQPMQCNIFKCLTHLRGTFFVLTILGCLLVDRFLAWSILLKKK